MIQSDVSNASLTTPTVPNITLESCAQQFNEIPSTIASVFCDWAWDDTLCWPPTAAGTTAKLKCPLLHGFDPSKFAVRHCSDWGQWAAMSESTFRESDDATNLTDRIANGTDVVDLQQHLYLGRGWTNYTPCYTPELYDLMKRISDTGNADTIYAIARRTRILEYVGLTVSLVALLISLGIFCRFRSLRNNRTRIHKNLFVAMCIQVVIRLTVYIDQAVIRHATGRTGIDNTPFLCETSYVLLEYARTAMFMWMFIEGLYLHNVVTFTVFQGKFPHGLYALLGWGGPVLLTAAWTAVTAYNRHGQKCWWGYNFTPYYWILEGPRLAVIVLNFCFLLNIVRVLVVKLRQSHTSDVEQVRKAVRAAAVLLPLLGITNLMNMVEAPIDRSVWKFALWSYGTHFLTSFQGFIIAMIYCFLNGEVRTVVLKNVTVFMTVHGYGHWDPRRPSVFSAAYVTAPETDAGGALADAAAAASAASAADEHCGRSNSPAPDIPSRNAARRTPSASSLSGCLATVRRLWKRDRNAHKEPSTVEIAANRMPLVAKDSDADNSVEMPQNGHAVATATAKAMRCNGNRASPYAFERPAPPETRI